MHRFRVSTSVALVLLLAAACEPTSGPLIINGDDDDATGDDDDATGNPNDLDGDVDPSATDCDDEDPTAYNGNTESCGDGVDNDCDPETFCYEAVGDAGRRFLDPFATDGSAADFYAPGEAQPFMNSDTITAALHRDGSTGEHSLVFVVDATNDGSGGSAFLEVAGVQGAELVVEDDPGEGQVDGDVGRFGFQWVECCVDGAVLTPLPRDLCVTFSVFEWDGLDDFVVADPAGEQTVGSIGGGLTICAGE